jgi:hypothetical protein
VAWEDSGPGGKAVLLTNAPVEAPVQAFEDDEDRRLIENCGIKEAKQQRDLGHPPQKTARVVRVPVVCTRLMFALATAHRRLCEREATGGEPGGWHRWRRQLVEQAREQVSVSAQGAYGSFHLAEYSLLVGVKLKDRPPGMGTRQDRLAQYGLITRR